MYKPKKPAYKKRAYKKRAYKRKPAISFNKKVAAVIHNMAENKSTERAATNSVLAPPSASGLATYVNLLPTSINQGAGSASRIGNEVRIVKNVLYGHINMLPYDATTNPFACDIMHRMIVFKKLGSNEYNSPFTLSDQNQFFQVNNASQAVTGQALDLHFRVNTDRFKVFRDFTFNLNAIAANLSPTFAAPVYASRSGDMVHKFRIDCTKYVTKLKFEDTNTLPSNANLYLAIFPIRVDGATSAGIDRYSEIHFVHDVQFEDL